MARRRTARKDRLKSRPTTSHSTPLSRRLRHPPKAHHRVLDFIRTFRRPSTASSHASSSAPSPPSSTDNRPVLAPLHFNLRRLPSRLALSDKAPMRAVSGPTSIQTGSKRKRVVSGNENASSGRSRSGGRCKRRRGSTCSATSDDESVSGMDVDRDATAASDRSDGEGEFESSEDYLIHEAPERQLLRLRKDRLLELYHAAGLQDSPESLTKQDIVNAITSIRDDEGFASLPPSSPRDRDGNSSEYSSDDGNVAGGEETDIAHRYFMEQNGLRRRVTVHDVGRLASRPVHERTFSLGHLEHSPTPYRKRIGLEESLSVSPKLSRKRTASLRSSPATSTASSSLPSPPATRLRTRKFSNDLQPQPSSSTFQRSKSKGKHVGFDDKVEVAAAEPELSELSELTESDADTVTTNPSPRRLRSQGSSRRQQNGDDTSSPVRTPPRRKAKEKVELALTANGGNRSRSVSVDQSDDEVDELAGDSSSVASTQVRRTPLKRRLRPRKLQTYTPPSDGDDEREEGDDDTAAAEGDNEGAEDETDQDAEEDSEVTPRKLRSGRVVGEIGAEEVEVEVDEVEAEEGGEDEGSQAKMKLKLTGFLVDLSTATVKSLTRLRRDDLVRLCETRQLETEGTKAHLAETLIKWYRSRPTDVSAPSSTATARPPSTARPRANGRRKRSSNTDTLPVLLRDHVHMDEPRTPPASSSQKEEDLELDLESLGLDDREIPPEKLTKLDKIGSGGFKDVFIGKFKGRKVAIAEFRGQLSSMDVKELKLLGGFDHPNIVRFLGVSIPPEDNRNTPVMIVSELCANGDLFDYIRNVPPPSLYRVLCIMLDIARGLEYLHMRKPSVIHRDCKSSNILITSKGVAKIADFGLAKVKQSTRSMVRSLVGTVNWQAPELWHPQPKYNHKVDVFACGVVYWEMLQWHVKEKKYPWEGMNEHAIYDAVGAKKQRPSTTGLRKQWCPEIIDLIERMWAQEHQDRPTMTEVVTELEGLVRKCR
ncbi:hypothetical protein K488DRAFT_50223 [Vararia minispora EC-137]|uniref:Uncharacterized protein n=1 Tax=Vararia minispora EC-137 TaxID=1314806 RepID=A0ACB8QL16_9AGAM|nr:hypothetical protein K488DRAFT_50223 [Vararia minispora EC-137]